MTAAKALRTRRRLRLGELLLNAGVLTAPQLERALAEQGKSGCRLGEALIQLEMVDEDQLIGAISQQLDVARIDLSDFNIDLKLATRLPEMTARRLRALVLTEQVDGYLVAMADPTDLMAEDELERQLGRPVHPAIVRERDLLRALDRVYLRHAQIAGLAEELGQEIAESGLDQDGWTESDDSDALVSRLINSLLEEAMRAGASDIHIEPGEDVLRIRFRVDGVLREQPVGQKQVAAALVSRLKLSAGLNIAERRMPQDGRFRVTVRGKLLDVRMSTMPTQHGETVVMRLLDQSSGLLDLGELGLPEPIVERLRGIIHRPNGMLLVTGPTGSGKSTTLYAALSELNSADRKIITIEDPVEYRLARVNQVQIQPQIGLDFSRVLRAALRQDPDVILVGEMRDRETVEIGLRAAITGHLVLSTLHTNDAPSTAVRLLDMGAPGYLIASALQAVVAQRLIRRLCERCSKPHALEVHERVWLESVAGGGAAATKYRQAGGCNQCNQTGYSGRIGIYELLELNGDLCDALRNEDAAAFVNAAGRAPAYRSLQSAALTHAQQGVTSLAEVLRVVGGDAAGYR
ncbi:MAG: GspE/PulE family protein [Woeseiaceae bacterium]